MGARSVLIIGGSGFVGTHLAVRLRDECKVFTTSFRHEGRIPGVTMIPISLDEPETVRMAVLASRAEVVVYAAGTPESASPKEIDLVHSAGPLRALSAASMLIGTMLAQVTTVQAVPGRAMRALPKGMQ